MRVLVRAANLRWIAVALALLVADAATAQTQVEYLGLSFPAQVAGFARGSSHDFEKSHPGLGYGVKYARAAFYANIYIYDLSRKSISDDPKSAIVSAQYKQAEGDIFGQKKSGRYRNVALRSRYTIRDARQRERMVCGAFTLTRSDRTHDSYLCVTSWNNKFVKFRLSAPLHKNNDAQARQFLDAWARLLWP